MIINNALYISSFLNKFQKNRSSDNPNEGRSGSGSRGDEEHEDHSTKSRFGAMARRGAGSLDWHALLDGSTLDMGLPTGQHHCSRFACRRRALSLQTEIQGIRCRQSEFFFLLLLYS